VIVLSIEEARELRDFLCREKSITPSLKALKAGLPTTVTTPLAQRAC
jgi:hypothetical protein